MGEEARFDVEAVFDPDDYRYFYDIWITDERSERESELIWRLLHLQPGLEVLDLACGYGRIANRLAARGCHVSGLDRSAAFLEAASNDAARRGLVVAYQQGDMRSLPWTARFDCIINWFTSFGYFADDDNRRVLAEAQRALKPGGCLLLELNNRDYLLHHLQRHSVVERDGNYLIDQMEYDVLTGRLHTLRTILRDGQRRQAHFSVRLLTLPELASWLRWAGFARVEGYDQIGGPYTLESRRLLVVAQKSRS
jgi:SAM-dependent methyltransferase